eukprot:NODE_2_length_91304_cov_0.692462.p79 type:complete len:115 gc:universal NODE_2_length_91304_cov_0.692462:33454-33110(-)
MNLPDRFEAIVLPSNTKKLEMKKDDTKPNTAIFKIEREDHTVAQWIVQKLQRQKNVIFAGYKVPHPLQHNFELRISTDGDSSPAEVFELTLTQILEEIGKLKVNFSKEIQNKMH